MAKEKSFTPAEQSALAALSTAPDEGRQSRELWRVVSADGSTRIFQTKPAADVPRVIRTAKGRASSYALAVLETAPQEGGTERRSPSLPPLVAENEPAAESAAANAELSAELTSVNQAWATLSPGIRGAIMSLIRASCGQKAPRSAGYGAVNEVGDLG